MGHLLRIWAIWVFAAKRLLSQRGLALASLLGVTSTAMLIMSIPLYVDLTFSRLLHAELYDKPSGRSLPPFAFLFHYLGAISGSLTADGLAPFDAYFADALPADLGLAIPFQVRFVSTDRFGFFPAAAAGGLDPMARIMTASFGAASHLSEHIAVAEGAFPSPASGEGAAVEVLMSQPAADKMGLQVGDRLVAFSDREAPGVQFPLRIAGVWRPNDPQEPYWFREPSAFDDVLLVPEETLYRYLMPRLGLKAREALWYGVADGSSVRTADVPGLIVRIVRASSIVSTMLPKVIITSPLAALQSYYEASRRLFIQIFAFSMPVIGLNLLFTFLVTGMAVERRRSEIAILRSRGATTGQVIGVAGLEGLVLGGLAFGLSLPGSMAVASLSARTRAFLDFTGECLACRVDNVLRIGLQAAVLDLGVVAIACAVVTLVLPTLGASRHTAVTYRQERARLLRPPLWQRAGLDVLLLIPAAYGVYLLRHGGGLSFHIGAFGAGADQSMAADPFQNPLLFLTPSLAALALTLLFIRLLPLGLRVLAWLAAKTRSVSFLMAIRYLVRAPGFYSPPMILLIVTLSLSVFLSGMAASLDAHLSMQTRYTAGAELVSIPHLEFGERGAGEANPGASAVSRRLPNWLDLPIAEYRRVPGVRAAAAVDRYRARLQPESAAGSGDLLAVDRSSFADVAFWQEDFAALSLADLMNRLAIAPDAVLLPQSLMARDALRIGDQVRLHVDIFGYEKELSLRIAGAFDLFPTWNPSFGTLFVMNLDYLYQQFGLELPASAWLATLPGTDAEAVAATLARMHPEASIVRPFYGGITAEAAHPERQGLFGILSAGFLEAAALATVGFILYMLFSFRRRAVELAVMRALGLSFWQLARYLAWELVFLLVLGIAGGLSLGIAISQLWIPFFRVGTGTLAEALPITVQFAWPQVMALCSLFGLVLVLAMVLAMILARRVRLSEAVKLMEAI